MNAEEEYNLSVSYYMGDDLQFELSNSTLKVIKNYSTDDFIQSFYNTDITADDDYICKISDSTGTNITGVVMIFANNTQVYNKQFNGDSQTQIITCHDLTGSLSGIYNMTVVYNKSGIIYSKDAVFNFTETVHNVELTVSDFKINFTTSEINIEDEDAVIITYYCPDAIKDISPQILVYYGDGEYDRQVYDIEADDINTFKNITWGSLYLWDTGVYNLTVYYGNYYEPTLKLAEFTLNAVDNHIYTAADFIELYPKIITDLEDYVCIVNDPGEDGLNGTVEVYANGVQIYSQKLTASQSTGVQIRAKNLTGNFNGDYNIKAVYKKANGTEYSLDETLTFIDIVNVNPTKTVITALSMSVIYGDNKNIVASLKDISGKAISNVNVVVEIMGVKYPLKTDKNGQVKQSLKSLPAGKRIIKFSFDGNGNYLKSTKSVTVNVKKATPKLTAKAKTFKRSDKKKQYTVTLKTNQNKVMKGVKITVKVNKKLYTARTNSKGVAVFKLNKLTKKGRYSAVIKYGGNSYYTAKSANVKITVK